MNNVLETNIEIVKKSPMETSAEIVDEIIADFMNPNRELPISTGYPSLTKYFSGFRRDQITILSARTSVGKTCTALNFTLNLINAGKNVLYFDLEEQKIQNFHRLLSNITNHPLRDDLDNPKLEVSKKEFVLKILELGRKRLNDKNLHYVSKPNLTLDDMKEIALNLKDIDLIVIDHLTKVKPSKDHAKGGIYERVTDVANNLRQLSYDLGGVPLLVLAQANREAEGRKPELSNLKGSGEIEENADVVVMLSPVKKEDEGEDEENNDEEPINVIVKKNRHGRTGATKLLLNRPLQQITELPESFVEFSYYEKSTKFPTSKKKRRKQSAPTEDEE